MNLSEEFRLLMIGIAIGLFFSAVYRILSRIIPNTFNYDILLIVIAVIILYFFDGTIKNLV